MAKPPALTLSFQIVQKLEILTVPKNTNVKWLLVGPETNGDKNMILKINGKQRRFRIPKHIKKVHLINNEGLWTMLHADNKEGNDVRTWESVDAKNYLKDCQEIVRGPKIREKINFD